MPVIAESAWLILDWLGATAHSNFLTLVANHDIEPIDLTEVDWLRVAELCSTYQDLRLDVVDASLVTVAERLRLDTIATCNRRDLAVVRPSHVEDSRSSVGTPVIGIELWPRTRSPQRRPVSGGSG